MKIYRAWGALFLASIFDAPHAVATEITFEDFCASRANLHIKRIVQGSIEFRAPTDISPAFDFHGYVEHTQAATGRILDSYNGLRADYDTSVAVSKAVIGSTKELVDLTAAVTAPETGGLTVPLLTFGVKSGLDYMEKRIVLDGAAAVSTALNNDLSRLSQTMEANGKHLVEEWARKGNSVQGINGLLATELPDGVFQKLEDGLVGDDKAAVQAVKLRLLEDTVRKGLPHCCLIRTH